jgi:hypothetical protein
VKEAIWNTCENIEAFPLPLTHIGWDCILVESRLEGVNRRNLKIINFEHALHLGLGLEINNSEFRVQKIVLLTMSCSINADNFGSQLKPI